MSAIDVLKSFDDFDWKNQIMEANRLSKVSPTLSVEDKTNERLIWVSAYGDETYMTFVSECKFRGMKKRFFGLLGEGPGLINLYAERFDMPQARKALELFVANNEAGLRHLYETN